MVLWHLCTLDHLASSGFGRPFPRHGLQLLFWFSNHCVSLEPADSGDVMKLVSECQPENAVYGFHKFGNVEELLPVLHTPKKHRSSRQLVYFVVGNLNTRSYPESADLPPFVRENHGSDGASNSDRLIIGYRARTKAVDRLYVTEHADADAGRFRPDGTHQVGPEVIRALQNPRLDLSAFLAQMGYYDDAEDQTTLGAVQSRPSPFFSDAFSQQLSWDQFRSDTGAVVYYTPGKKKKKKKKKKRRSRDFYEDYWITSRRRAGEPYGAAYEYYEYSYGAGYEYYAYSYGAGYGRGGGGGGGGGFSSFLRILLKVGAIYLAAKSFIWLLRRLWRSSWDGKLLHVMPGRTNGCLSRHVMLDYVY